VSSGNFLPTFWVNLSVLLNSWTLRMGLIGCPKMLVPLLSVITQRSAFCSYFMVEVWNHTFGALLSDFGCWNPCKGQSWWKALSLCLPWRHVNEWQYSTTLIFNLGTGWRRVDIFMPRPLFPHGKGPWYSFSRGGWVAELVWMCWGVKKLTTAGNQMVIR
jgi:hypothetical protein